jgi:hypothetical protein
MSAPVISELIAASFQGPLEIERMLSPVETNDDGTLRAFLFCAVTPVRPAHYGAFHTDAKRHSFSLNSCFSDRFLTLVAWVRANCFRMKVALRPAGIMGQPAQAKKYPSRWRGERYVNALQHQGQVKSWKKPLKSSGLPGFPSPEN